MNASQINLIPADPRCFCGISFLSGFCFTQFVEKICKIYEIIEEGSKIDLEIALLFYSYLND